MKICFKQKFFIRNFLPWCIFADLFNNPYGALGKTHHGKKKSKRCWRSKQCYNPSFTLQVAARALVVKNKQLLLVSHDKTFWYTPGGRLNPDETLPACIIREVKEETGLDIEPQKVIFVFEFFDRKENIHKVEIYFAVKIKSQRIPKNWSDQEGPVKFIQFFSFQALKGMHNLMPNFLKKGEWLTESFNIYQDAEENKAPLS